jgi:predicted GIY-YIG superfamily endonuclease
MKTGLNNRLTWAEHTVYRLYDNQQRLISVGCTNDLIKRLRTHQKTAWWYPQIERIQTEVHPGRNAGLHAEARIRDTEHPRWNIEARWMKRNTWNRQMFADYITALENHQSRKYSSIQRRLEKARDEFHQRYGTNQQQAA